MFALTALFELTHSLHRQHATRGASGNLTFFLSNNNAFWAEITAVDEAFRINVSEGVVVACEKLWSEAGDPIDGPTGAADTSANASIKWLLLHEMQHADLGHLDLMQSARIAETRNAPSMGVVQRSGSPVKQINGITGDQLAMVPLCLEMQADHDAIEVMLEAYHPERWRELRERAAAISAMMVLIEREDAKNKHGHTTHPKAATRIFQLLGHLIQMPTLAAVHKARLCGSTSVDLAVLPSDEEQAGYQSDVLLPAYHDAVHLAKVAGAQSFTDDLGDPENFFADVQLAMLQGTDARDEFRTVGARQWAELHDFNAVLMQKFGLFED